MFTREARKASAVTVKGILTAFQNRLIMGRVDRRALDVEDETMAHLGMTSPISIDRDDLLGTAFYEILSADKREFDGLDIRLPLEVTFFGEGLLNSD